MRDTDPRAPLPPEMEAQAQELLRQPYHKLMSTTVEGDVIVAIPELPGCWTAAETEAAALAQLPEAMGVWFESVLVRNEPIPAPFPERGPSDHVLVQMPEVLHEHLMHQAERGGVSLNQWIVTLLSHACGERAGRDIGVGQEALPESVPALIEGALASTGTTSAR